MVDDGGDHASRGGVERGEVAMLVVKQVRQTWRSETANQVVWKSKPGGLKEQTRWSETAKQVV